MIRIGKGEEKVTVKVSIYQVGRLGWSGQVVGVKKESTAGGKEEGVDRLQDLIWLRPQALLGHGSWAKMTGEHERTVKMTGNGLMTGQQTRLSTRDDGKPEKQTDDDDGAKREQKNGPRNQQASKRVQNDATTRTDIGPSNGTIRPSRAVGSADPETEVPTLPCHA